MRPPSISVIVPTLNRGPLVAATVESILTGDDPDFELVVCDQSPDGESEKCLLPFRSDPRLHYVRSPTRGSSANRNIGARLARGEILALTDDDCTVPPDWLTQIRAAFQQDGRISIVLGDVLAGLHDTEGDLVISNRYRHAVLARGVFQQSRIEALAACMAVRKCVWQQLDGFDEMLGDGSTFQSAGETDFVVRALAAGAWAYQTPEVSVTHHGARLWSGREQMVRGYTFGLGALLAKQMKLGCWRFLAPTACLALRWAFMSPRVDLGWRPPRFLRLKAYLSGFLEALSTPVDRSRGHFVTCEPETIVRQGH